MTAEGARRVVEGWERYKLRQRMAGLESLLISYGVDAVLSPNRGKIVGVLENRKLKPHAPPRESLTVLDDLSESLSIIRVLRNWFTEVPSLASPIIDGQRNVMRCDGASDCWPARLDCFHSGASGSVFKYNP